MRVVRDGDVYSRKWVTHEMDIEERGRVLTNLKHKLGKWVLHLETT